ncbi:putative nuclease HARBI1 isoform X2 [Photinus pyralis]|uniref:putative nuclease HARBI1 isoform X2 n=1 Tax=Photinus pyralis TaxID=7054 RepID=UPI001266EEE7|nr:putative nuclease HARBI1 isoform X2 [Photinus pyralis]
MGSNRFLNFRSLSKLSLRFDCDILLYTLFYFLYTPSNFLPICALMAHSSDEGSSFDGEDLLHTSSNTSDENEELIVELNRRVRHPRTFRSRPDNFTKWTEEEFRMRFRLCKATTSFLLTLIQDQLVHRSNRNHAVSAMNQLLLTLRLYATGSMLIAVGDFIGVDKSTASRIVKKVTTAICTLAGIYIQMPRMENAIRRNQLAFYNIARFPRVIGAIDCTHVRIQSPGGDNAEYFRNRKDVVARWPGSTHDQTVFNNSRIHARLETNEFGNSIILGDSGYAIKQYLITPLLNPHTEGEQLFNEAQIRSRNPIERLFGVWKRRFPILSLGIRLSLETTQSVIIACAVLHNIAQERNEDGPLVDPDVILPNNDDEIDDVVNVPEAGNINNNFRQTFIDYFSSLP